MRREKRKDRTTPYYDNTYYKENNCPCRNCYFNYNGFCLVTKGEHPKPLTYDNACFNQILEHKSPENLKRYFLKRSYFIRRDQINNHPVIDCEYEPPKKIRITILSVNKNDQVNVMAKVGRYRIRSTLDFRELFEYELKRRYMEYLQETLNQSNYLDLNEPLAA